MKSQRGLVFRDGKLLITQRHADAHLGGLWEFPGGKREGNETFEECLKRELREELGIEVEVGEVLESLTHAYPEKTVALKFFRCRWKQNEPRAIDCLDLKWVTRGRVGQLRISSGGCAVVGDAAEFVRDFGPIKSKSVKRFRGSRLKISKSV